MIADLKDVLQGRSVLDLNKEERDMVRKYLDIMLEGWWIWELTPLEFKSLVELITIDLVTILFDLPKDNFSAPDNWRQKTLDILEYFREKIPASSWMEVFDFILLWRNPTWDAFHYGRRSETQKEGLARAVVDFLAEGKVIQPFRAIFFIEE